MRRDNDLVLSRSRAVIGHMTARDHSTGLCDFCRCSIDPISWTVFEILSRKCIPVATLTLRVTWRHRSRDPYTIYYRWSTGANTLSPSDFEILKLKYIWVTTLTFQGHVTSSVTWPFDSHYVVSYRCSADTFFLSSMVTEIFWSTCPILSQACIFPLKLAWHDFRVV